MLEDLAEAFLKIISSLAFSTLGIASLSQLFFKVLQNCCDMLRSTFICLDKLIVIKISTGNPYLFYDANQSLIGEAKFSKVLFSRLNAFCLIYDLTPVLSLSELKQISPFL